MSEARKLASIQSALDAHAEGCADPVRAILLNPWEAEQLDWWEFRGIPIETDSRVPTGIVKIDCLSSTVREAIEDFQQTIREDGSIADAEARLKAKLDQLAAMMDDWWAPVRSPHWWRNVAQQEPDLYRRFLRGEEWSLTDHIKAESAQFFNPEDSPENTFRAWQDAWADMDAEDRGILMDGLSDIPEDILHGVPERPSNAVSVLRAPKAKKVSVWHRFLNWLRGERPARQRPKSSIRSALDRYGRSGQR